METQSAEDAGIANVAYTNIFPSLNRLVIGEEGIKNGVLKNGTSFERLSGVQSALTCATITILPPNDTASTGTYSFPFEFMVDYGTQGCESLHDGKLRKGKIKASFDNFWDSVGSNLTIELIDYYENNINITGDIIVEYTGNKKFDSRLIDGHCLANNWDIGFEYNHQYEWLSGFNSDSIITDDVVRIAGTASGVNRDGVAFTNKVITPIEKDMTCKWISKGVIEIKPEGLDRRTIDFGNGTCDNKASLTINGNVFEIKLK